MIALFRQKSPANLMMLLIFSLLIKAPYLLHPQVQPAAAADGLLYRLAVQWLVGGNAYVGAILAFGLLYGHALIINYAVNEYRLTTRHSFLPAMSYMLATSLLPEWNYFSAPLLASTFVIWALLRLFRLYNVEVAKGRVYNIGLIMGLAAMVFLPSALFLLFILVGLLVLRPFRLNEWLLLLMGVATPFYFHAVYLFLADRLIVNNILPRFTINIPQVKSSLPLAIAAALSVVPFMIGSFHIQEHLRKMLIQVRKNWSIVLIYLLLALFVPFINSNNNYYNWVLAMPPFAAFHACAYLYPTKKWVPQLLFWVTVAVVVAQQYGVVKWG